MCVYCQASAAPEARAEAHGLGGAPREGQNWQAIQKAKGDDKGGGKGGKGGGKGGPRREWS